eukprot:442703_1
MTTQFKSTLLNTIDSARCYSDLSALITMLPFDIFKSTLRNHVKNDMNNDEIVRKEYYNRLSIETILPMDILVHVLSFQTFQCLYEYSSKTFISITMQKASKIALNKDRPLTLCISSDIESFSLDRKYPNDVFLINFDDLLYHAPLRQMTKQYWHNFVTIIMDYGDLDYMVDKLQISLQNIKCINYQWPSEMDKTSMELSNQLSYTYSSYQCDFTTNTTTNLQFVHIDFGDIDIWNILIRNCPNLHGLILNADSNVRFDYRDKDCELNIANNLWLLKFPSDKIDYRYVEIMIAAAPNLYHLSINAYMWGGLHNAITTQPFLTLPTRNLISLTIDENVIEYFDLLHIDLKHCLQLIYLEIPIYTDCEQRVYKSLMNIVMLFINQTASRMSYIGINGSNIRSISDESYHIAEFGQNLKLTINYDENALKTLNILTDSNTLSQYERYQKLIKFVTKGLMLEQNKIQHSESILECAAMEALSVEHDFVRFIQMLRKEGIISNFLRYDYKNSFT